MKEDKKLAKAKERFKLAEEAWSENRQEALDDLKFARLGEQWPADIREKREREGRPCLTINRLPAFIRQVVNDARLNSPSIKVHPADDFADVDTAEVVNGLIRNIEATSNAEIAYDSALQDAVTCGEGFFRIDIAYAHDDAFDLDLKIERIANPLSVFFDPMSMEADASDWSYCFVVEEMSKEAFKSAYPNADTSNWDDAETQGWVTDESVRVAEYWSREEVEVELLLLSNGLVLHEDRYNENKHLFDAQGLTIAQTRPSKTFRVKQCILSGAEILEENDWPGRFIPIVPVFGDEIVVEGKRYFQSMVRQSKDAQRNYNYWRTAGTERVALATKAPWIGPVGAFDTDIRKWETANSDTHPFIEYDGVVPPQQTAPSMADAGAITEALSASDDLKNIMGLQDASLGRAGNETSGKAIMARQREGDVSTFHFIDNLARGIRYAGRVVLDLIPHVYNEARVIRVMGYDGTPKDVQINQEFVANGVTKLHDLTKGKYDLIVETGPSFTSKREEAATQMIEMLRSFPQAAPIIGDLVAKNLDWPGADEIAKRLKTLLPPQIQAMEKMDGLPPEAQAAIAQSQQQIEQLTQVIEQGKQMLVEKDKEIEALSMQTKDKSIENQIKAADIEKKYAAQMAKIQADLEIAQAKIKEDQRELIVDTMMNALDKKVDALSAFQAKPVEDIGSIINTVSGNSQQVSQLLAMLVEAESREKTKTVKIQAPSGAIYEGIVTEQ